MTLSADNPIELAIESTDYTSQSARVFAEILRGPGLWNGHKLRTANDGPHRHVHDIWLRCLDWEVMSKDPARFNEPHESTWYPLAREELGLLADMAVDIFKHVGGVELGGVLVTKIPAGCCVMPHVDQGWHARHYEKFAFSIAANEMQEFCFEKKRLVTQPGDVFTFDNQYSHWVTNPSPQDRITMIVCIRRPRPPDLDEPT